MAPSANSPMPPSHLVQWDNNARIHIDRQGKLGNLLINYAQVPPQKIEEHVKKIAKRGWEISGYPSFGKLIFLDLDFYHSTQYRRALEAICKGGLFLDLGCGMGQDIRCLVQDHAPTDNLIGLDIVPEFVDLGYELFGDKARLTSRFLIQNFFEDTPEIEALVQRIQVINSGYFMHLFDWDTQLEIANRMTRFLVPERGAFITGIHFGNNRSARSCEQIHEGRAAMYLHDEESLRSLWDQSGEETGSTWRFTSVVDDDGYCKELDADGCRIRWVVERQ